MDLYLVRHGESEANMNGLHAGWAPVHLTVKGVSDAKRIGACIDGIKFDKIFCSDLVRTRETCFYAIGADKPEFRKELRELDVGILAGQSPKVLMSKFGDTYSERYYARDYRAYGGESMIDLFTRVSAFMQELESSSYSCFDNIIAFSSEGPIDMALSYALGVNDPKLFRNLLCDNCSICILRYTKDHNWVLKQWNYTGKLM